MEELVGFHPTNLSKEELQALQEKMAKANKNLVRCSLEQYGNVNIKKLRKEFNSGKLTLVYDPAAKNAFLELQKIENDIIAAYIKIASRFMKILKKGIYFRPGVTTADYMQEAALAIYDAIYTYNGNNCFSTYVTYCMRNRLINYCRKEEHIANVGGRKNIDLFLLTAKKTNNINNENVQLAIEYAHLTTLEREMIMAFLAGESRKQIYTRMQSGKINNKTGKPLSLQRMSMIFRKACDKIKAAYLLLRKAA